MNCTLRLHDSPLPASWGLPSAPAGMRAWGLDWAPLDVDGGPPQLVCAVTIAALLQLGRLAFLDDAPSTSRTRMPWGQQAPVLTVTDNALVGQSLFDSVASWSQQGQAVAVLAPGPLPAAASLAQAAPARQGALAALFGCPSVLLVLLPAIDGAAMGIYEREGACGEETAPRWEAALRDAARHAGLAVIDARAAGASDGAGRNTADSGA